MTYRAATVKEMLGGLYDLVGIHGSQDDLTPAQRDAIKRLYYEVDPHRKIEQKFEEAKLHAAR